MVNVNGLRTAILQAVNHFAQDDDFMVVTDFHLHLDTDTGEVAIADDTEMTIASAVVEEWVDLDGDDDMETLVRELKTHSNKSVCPNHSPLCSKTIIRKP